MFDIATHMSRSISILLRYFDLITATAEKPALHKYDVAKGTRKPGALQPTSGNSDRALTQKEMSKLKLYKLFKVRSEKRSINCLASRDVSPERHLDYQQKDFLSNCASPCLQKNISQTARLEHSNANTSQSSYHTHRYSAWRDCQIANLNKILKVKVITLLVIYQQISLSQLYFSFKGCNFVI